MTTREIVVDGSLQRHQVREYLKVAGVEWVVAGPDPITSKSTFMLDATDEQWGRIQDWVKKVTG